MKGKQPDPGDNVPLSFPHEEMEAHSEAGHPRHRLQRPRNSLLQQPSNIYPPPSWKLRHCTTVPAATQTPKTAPTQIPPWTSMQIPIPPQRPEPPTIDNLRYPHPHSTITRDTITTRSTPALTIITAQTPSPCRHHCTHTPSTSRHHHCRHHTPSLHRLHRLTNTIICTDTNTTAADTITHIDTEAPTVDTLTDTLTHTDSITCMVRPQALSLPISVTSGNLRGRFWATMQAGDRTASGWENRPQIHTFIPA